MKKNRIFKISLLLMLTIVLIFGTAQGFASTPKVAKSTVKTKISTVDWNMMSITGPPTANQKRTNTNLYWFKFAFLDKSMSSGTLQEICSNEFNQLKSDMKMPGYFFPYYTSPACPRGEKLGMGVIYRGKRIASWQKVFKDQTYKTHSYGNYARGMVCVKHLYLEKQISTCVTHIAFDTKVKHYIRDNALGGRQLKESIIYSTLFSLGAGGKSNVADITFLNGDFNQFPSAVAKNTSGFKSAVVAPTHNALLWTGPKYQLDYIMVPSGLTSSPAFKPVCNLGSDHCMIGASVWH